MYGLWPKLFFAMSLLDLPTGSQVSLINTTITSSHGVLNICCQTIVFEYQGRARRVRTWCGRGSIAVCVHTHAVRLCPVHSVRDSARGLDGHKLNALCFRHHLIKLQILFLPYSVFRNLFGSTWRFRKPTTIRRLLGDVPYYGLTVEHGYTCKTLWT